MIDRLNLKNENLLNHNDTIENFNVGKFIFTKKTITYDSKTIQLSNVTKIAQYSYSERWKKKFKIPTFLFILAIIIGGITGLITIITYNFNNIADQPFIFFILSTVIFSYGVYERMNRKSFIEDYFGLIIETSSGKAENLLTQNYDFIHSLFNEITKAMNDEGYSKIVANFNNHEIKYEHNSHVGKVVIGDSFDNINDANITNRSTVNTEKLDLNELLNDDDHGR